jgi:DNA-binding XRE family transcriptional regulator
MSNKKTATAKKSVVKSKKAKASKKRVRSGGLPFIMKENYISVTVSGKPHSFNPAHPSFSLIKEALLAKDFRKVRNTIVDGDKIFNQTAGKIVLDRGIIKYEDKPVNSALTKKILELVHGGHTVKHMMSFMDNLYQNPDTETRDEIFKFLERHQLPITDDGCFIAYKAVKSDYTDCYSGTVSNKLGQVVTFPRKVADTNRRNLCSYGLHFASLQYVRGFGGSKVMGIKINPRDVIAVPLSDEGKGRCIQYEVVFELGEKNAQFNEKGHPLIESNVIIPVYKERLELLKAVLGHPRVKERIAKKVLSEKTLRKSTFGRLQRLVSTLDVATPVSPLFTNNLSKFRQAANLTVPQLAKSMDCSPTALRKIEREGYAPTEKQKSEYIMAIEQLKNIDPQRSAVSFPVPSSASVN